VRQDTLRKIQSLFAQTRCIKPIINISFQPNHLLGYGLFTVVEAIVGLLLSGFIYPSHELGVRHLLPAFTAQDGWEPPALMNEIGI
jgi:uncharacterized membrane protein YvlD (DUF360 family)